MVTLRLTKRGRKALRKAVRKNRVIVVRVRATDRAGNRSRATGIVRLVG